MLGILTLLSGCAEAVYYEVTVYKEPVGFWYGLWHGFISPIAFIGSLFTDNIAIYAVYNNGSWYDFGYLLGVGSFGFNYIKK